MKASFRNIEAVRSWFFLGEKPYWSVWSGFSKETKDLAMRNSTVKEIDESWNLLEKILRDKTEGGGRVTIFVTETANSSSGYTEYLEVASVNNAAIAGTGIQSQQFFGIGGVQEYIDTRISMAEQKRKIEDLEARLEEKETGTGINKVFNKILEEAPIADLLMALAAKFLGAPVMNPAINGSPRITDDAQVAELSEVDQERMHNAILRISAIFPNVVDAMEQLATFCEKNPEMAKSFLNKL